jgi:hypothetical protein
MQPQQVEQAARLVASGIHWERFIELAIYHRVFPLVHRNWKRHASLGVPPEIREQLQEFFQDNQVQMMAMTAELLRLTRALEEGGVPALALKGPALATRAFGNVVLRPAGDLDLLVRQSHIPRGLALLQDCGYRINLNSPGSAPSARQQAAISRFLYHYILVDPARETTVELHFKLSPEKMPFNASAEELFERASVCRIGGRDVKTLGDEDNLIFLCVHGSKHAWSRLEWIVCLAELIGKIQVSEEKLWHLANRRAAGLPLLVGLFLANRLMETQHFPWLSEKAAATPAVKTLYDQFLRNLEVPQSDARAQEDFQWVLCSSQRRGLRWWFYAKIQPKKADIRYADTSLFFLYYFIRQFRLIRRQFLQRIWKRSPGEFLR